MEFLLNWPWALSFFFVSAVTTTIAVLGLYLVRKKYPADVLKENHEVAAIIFNAFGVLYAVVVAFVVFVTWNGYDEATKNLQLEASQVLDIFHSARAFPDPASKIIQDGLIDYTNSVHNDELRRMAGGDIGIYSTGSLRNLIAVFDGMNDKSIPNRELYMESLRRINNLAEYRRLRIFAGNDTVPPMVWLILLVGGLITVSYTYFFGVRNIRGQYIMTSALTIMISLILFLVYVLDHPFTGTGRVSAKPFSEAMELMQKEYSEPSVPR
jgi:Na+/proline symporter